MGGIMDKCCCCCSENNNDNNKAKPGACHHGACKCPKFVEKNNLCMKCGHNERAHL